MAIRVIGAGFGRTGTFSLKMALEDLGFGKCYHMVELLKNRSGVIHWENAHKQFPVDWESLFRGYRSAVDFPACCYFDDLMRFYPDAKIVLTIRDAESWYASAKQTILSVKPSLLQTIAIIAKLPFSQDARHLTRIGTYYTALISKRLADENNAKRVYVEHNDKVRQLVPSDRLLVYEIEQGWGPLCEFLELPIPSKRFPLSNKREDFAEILMPLLW